MCGISLRVSICCHTQLYRPHVYQYKNKHSTVVWMLDPNQPICTTCKHWHFTAPPPLMGISLSLWNLYVSVCRAPTGHSFCPGNMRKKRIFFEIFIFDHSRAFFSGHFQGFSSLSFVFILYRLQVIPMDLQTSFLAQIAFMFSGVFYKSLKWS